MGKTAGDYADALATLRVMAVGAIQGGKKATWKARTLKLMNAAVRIRRKLDPIPANAVEIMEELVDVMANVLTEIELRDLQDNWKYEIKEMRDAIQGAVEAGIGGEKDE
jgi:hypothetical protein